MRFLLRVIVNALALWVAAWLLPGMDVHAREAVTGDPTVDTLIAYLVIGLVFGAVNAVVKPLISFLSLPITCLTLGLFTIIINAGMLMLTVWLTSYLPMQVTVDDFWWTAVIAAIVISIVSVLANGILGTRRGRGD
ncbi:phage holin family protein [Citricoccus sp. SGAir0253]|uniref:phage holin family protein n=1 Tax=Citricoccus sp. SGAir0253 TaxID=2567881 RepID=UPI0010CD0C36|nr:phage holin family protein [Citricoccus sp. SGAir0253]QCU77052.1 phage holin family protein [Citricoccus sp. SGAir0253]